MVSEINSLNSESEISSLIRIGKAVVDRGLVVGSGGNLSMLMKSGKEFLITRTGSELDQLDESSFALMDLDGNLATGSAKPSSEYRVHLESYRARKDINTCIHLHPQASVLTAALDLPIRFLTIDHVYYVRKVTRVPWIRSGTQEIADATAVAAKDANIIILENHGCVVLAPSVQLGFARVLNLEEASELTLRCHDLGLIPTEVPQAYWDHLRENDL